MKIILIAKKLALYSLLLLSAKLFADSCAPCVMPCAPIRCAPVCSYVSDCCPPPLNCGCFNVEVKGGVAPTLWTKRGRTSIAVCTPSTGTISPTTPGLLEFFHVPKFKCAFGLPFIVGVKAGYAWTCNLETYLEFDYSQAKAKRLHAVIPVTTIGQIDLRTITSKYKVFSGYLGHRYYFDRCWNCTSFFVGSKIGLAHYDSICNRGTSTPSFLPEGQTLVPAVQYRKTNTISGGLHAGVDVNLWCNFSFVFTAEVVASGALRTNQRIVQPSQITGTSTLVPGNFESQVFFPITFGLKYNF